MMEEGKLKENRYYALKGICGCGNKKIKFLGLQIEFCICFSMQK